MNLKGLMVFLRVVLGGAAHSNWRPRLAEIKSFVISPIQEGNSQKRSIILSFNICHGDFCCCLSVYLMDHKGTQFFFGFRWLESFGWGMALLCKLPVCEQTKFHLQTFFTNNLFVLCHHHPSKHTSQYGFKSSPIPRNNQMFAHST